MAELKKKFTSRYSKNKNYKAENTKVSRQWYIGSTVFHEARKPVNFESPTKISLLFINHLSYDHTLKPFFPHTEESCIQPLSILHFFANLVAQYLVPVDFGAGDWKLPAQGLECGV